MTLTREQMKQLMLDMHPDDVASTIETLIRERDEARAKALDEAAAVAEEWESGESAAFYIRELKAKDPK